MSEMSGTSGTSGASGIPENLQLIVRSIKRTRNKLGCGFLIVLGIGVGMAVGGFYSEEASIGLIIFGAVCILLAAVGVKIVLPNLSPANSPLIKLLTEHPENIAWIFVTVDPGSGGIYGKSKNVNVNDTDKKCHTFAVKEKDLDEVMATLKTYAPRAAIGLDKEIQKKYAADPWSVMSDS